MGLRGKGKRKGAHRAMRVTIPQYPQAGFGVWIVHAVGYRRSTALTSTGIDQGSPEPGTRTGGFARHVSNYDRSSG